MPNPEKDGWYMATYGDYTGEYLYTKGEWWAIVYIIGNKVMEPCHNPDTWKEIDEWQDEGE